MIAGAMLALAAAAVMFVLAPLRRAVRPAPWQAERDRLLREREAAYRALRELEFDRDTGKLSAADYAALRGRCEREAVEVLKRLDALSASPPPEPAAAAAPETSASSARALAPDPSESAAPVTWADRGEPT